MARLSYLGLVTLLVVGLCLAGSVSGAMNLASQSRQSPSAPAAQSTSLVAHTASSLASLRKILLPAIQSLIGAPLQMLRQLLLELAAYIRTHSLADLYSVKTLRVMASKLPERVSNYWIMLTEMESQCMHRTLCDIADLTSQRAPSWANQILLIYFNTFSEAHPHYSAIVNGLTNHQCKAVYQDCDAQQFLARVQGNLTESFSSTVGPVKEAFEGLVNVTATTLSSLLVDLPNRPNGSGSAVISRPNSANGRINDDDEEEGRSFDEFSRGRFDERTRQNGEPMMIPQPTNMRRPFPRTH